MKQPLFYIGFILCLVFVTICFVALIYLSYRKSSMLRDMAQFVVFPKDDLISDFKISIDVQLCENQARIRNFSFTL